MGPFQFFNWLVCFTPGLTFVVVRLEYVAVEGSSDFSA